MIRIVLVGQNGLSNVRYCSYVFTVVVQHPETVELLLEPASLWVEHFMVPSIGLQALHVPGSGEKICQFVYVFERDTKGVARHL